MIIFKTFTFDSAHFLPNVPPDHKCREIHGHTYTLTVYIEGPLHPELGWVADFKDIKDAIEPTVKLVDHKLINNIPGLENPTCEIFAIWFWDNIKPLVPGLKKVTLNETPTSGAEYEGD
jgi:6-pyruvoyltetrahydropterin/6-carboxytetrahydropterin synthase